MINVTKTFLPDFDEYVSILKRAWDNAWITNNGPLVRELEQKLRDYLGAEHLLFCTNGTVVLQLALKVLNITKEVITTPFSYVATTNVILWEGCTPVFVDIDKDTLCIDADKIEAAITPETQAILATHVYGIPCDVVKIAAIAKKHNLKVIYDAAHAFGCMYNGKSLLTYGDISTCSFHATKVFHTVEGGCIITNDSAIAEKLDLYRSFGHRSDDYFSVGINAKNSEFHAAMGLAVLPRLAEIISARKKVFDYYNEHLHALVFHPLININEFNYNYSYYPVIFESEEILIRVRAALEKMEINTRRYFFPSLNTLDFVSYRPCAVSEDVSGRALCLPLYHDIAKSSLEIITTTINKTITDGNTGKL